MKITKSQIKRIIKEELMHFMDERRKVLEEVEQTPEERAEFKRRMAMSPEEAKADRTARKAKRLAARKAKKAQPDTSQAAAELAKKLKPYFPPAAGMATAVITALVKAPDEAAARKTFPSQFEEKLIRAWGFIKKQIALEQRDNPDLKETDVYIAMARDEGWTEEYIGKIAGGAG
jgi:phage-related minor tail protein